MALTEGQQRCVETLDRPLVVAAGAGSGKTFTLTKRIAGALESGFVEDIDEICAITFTNKAAAELKSRIKGELRACGMVDQALKVDDAWISTIHGMCARILRAHAIELGIDPTFTIAEGSRVDEYLSQAVDEVLAGAQVRGASAALDGLFAEYPARSGGGFGESVEGMLASLVLAGAASEDGISSFVLPGVTLNPALALDQAIELVETLLDAAQQEKQSSKRDEWLATVGERIEAMRALGQDGAVDCVSALEVVSPVKLAKTFGSKDYKAQVDEARGVFDALVMELRLGAARPHLETLIGLADRALGLFMRKKHDDGVLDNNDLLVMASRAISDHPDIAALYSDKFKLVMVDEFQDTDQMQVDMIKRIAGEGACRLCTVGDAQQSIYRFRGADVSVYRRHLAAIRSEWPDGVIELSDNFRSHADVLAFVDCVFEKPAMFGGEFMSLAAGRDEGRVKQPYAAGAPRVFVQHTSAPARGVRSDQLVETSARRIASAFAQFRQDGHSAGEMVVLLGRMSHADVYAQALRDRGLPCVIAGGGIFSRSQEARFALELARVIANPGQTQSLFNVLASPAFSLTAGDLLAIGGLARFQKEARATARAMADDASPAPSGDGARSPLLECALRVMGQVFEDANRMSVARLIERVLADSGWLSRLEAQGAEGLACAGNLFKAVRMVDRIEREGASGPASVARLFEETLASSKEAPGALSVSGGDSVRIMTIHASKGLEFPIVAVAELQDKKAPSSKLFVSSVEGRTYVSLDLGGTLDRVGKTVGGEAMAALGEYVLGPVGDEDELVSLAGRDEGALHRRLALRQLEALGDGEEAKRLLYVALTRAKEALVVSSVGKRSKDDPLGVPGNAFSGVFAALDPTGATIGTGVSLCDFGGSHPAVVEHVALQADDGEGAGEKPDEFGAGPVEGPLPGDYLVPVVLPARMPDLEPYRPAHEGVFSYSSIADASHEGDLLDQLAQSYAVSVDSPAEDGCAFESAGSARGQVDFMGSSLFADDDFWDIAPSSSFDEDRATDLGTAFHRLAQYAVNARNAGNPLVPPPSDRVKALSKACALDVGQRGRLARALDRWFGSDVAAKMSGYDDLRAEVPFFVAVDCADGRSACLEGEIDLLALDGPRAVVVDYKTGGHADESDDDLRRKHVLQASCYAYAIMLQGVEEVEAVFVRVEQPRGTDPAQPQCVRYRFTGADVHRLEAAIASLL